MGGNMSILKYEIYRDITITKNFTRTAENLNLTQSAVSHAMKSFEEELGFELFIRSKKGVGITKAGHDIQAFVEGLLTSQRRLENKVNAINGKDEGHLRIGSMGSTSTNVLPELIYRYKERYPGIELTFKEGGLDEMRDWLENDQADIIFLVEELITPDMYAEPCFEDEIMALIPKNYGLGELDSIPISVLEDHPFILSYANPHKYMQILFKRHRVKPNILYSFSLNNTVMAMVEKGLGLSMLPDSVMNNYRYDFDILSFDQPIIRKISLVTKKGNASNPLVKVFFDINRELVSAKKYEG